MVAEAITGKKYDPKRVTFSVSVSERMLEIIDEAKERLGMTRSDFIVYCVVRTLNEFSLLKGMFKLDEVLEKHWGDKK